MGERIEIAATGSGLAMMGDVMAAFGLAGIPERLGGGQGNSYRVGGAVLKSGCPETDELNWVAAVEERIVQDGFRVPRRLRTREGGLVYRDWVAWELVGAAPSMARWDEMLRACDAFHRALEGIKRPAFLSTRTSQWDTADRMVWGEIPVQYDDGLGFCVGPLLQLLRPVSLPEQVIHGDFGGGNLLFPHDGGAPYVIDFSPYYRPAGFAKAVAVVDAVAWYHAPLSLLGRMDVAPDSRQLLLRATLRRLLESKSPKTPPAYQPVVDHLTRDAS